MYQTRDYLCELALIAASQIQRAAYYDYAALENYQPNEEELRKMARE